MKSLTTEITAHLKRKYEDYPDRHYPVWAMANLPSTVDGKSICENLRILSGVTSILQLAKVKLSSE